MKEVIKKIILFMRPKKKLNKAEKAFIVANLIYTKKQYENIIKLSSKHVPQ